MSTSGGTRRYRAAVPALWPAVAAPVAVAVVLLGPAVPRVVAGLALALVLPGLALRRALFPGRALSTVERWLLVPALSLATLVLGGLALYAAGVPLHRTAWALLTGAVTVAAVLVRAGTAGPVPPGVPAGPGTRAYRRPRPAVPVSLLAAAALLAGAAWLSVASARATDAAVAVVELSVVSNPSTVDRVAGTRTAVLAVGGNRPGPYQLRVSGPDGYVRALAVRVAPGGTWRAELVVPAGERVTAELFRPGTAVAFRTVYLAPVGVAGTG